MAASAQLYAGLTQFLVAANTYLNVAYLTAQDIVAAFSAAVYTSGVAKVLACTIVGVAVGRFATEGG